MLLKSPVNRIGGKYYLVDWLVSKLPCHVLSCEPFCGAGHLLFAKEPSPVEILNDVDHHLIGFFRVIQHPETRQMLIEKLNYMPYSRSLWNRIRSQWKAGDIPQDEIERAAWWYYLNRTTFSGDQKGGGFAVLSITGRNPCTSFRNTIKTLDDVAERLRGVIIENLPYAECFRRYDSPETLFYCDPPYLNTEHYYGKNSFSQDDHCKLAKLLNEAKAKVMVSHYQNGLYDELYREWNKATYQSFKGSHKAEPGTEKPVTVECLWTNFEPKQRGLFDAME